MSKKLIIYLLKFENVLNLAYDIILIYLIFLTIIHNKFKLKNKIIFLTHYIIHINI